MKKKYFHLDNRLYKYLCNVKLTAHCNVLHFRMWSPRLDCSDGGNGSLDQILVVRRPTIGEVQTLSLQSWKCDFFEPTVLYLFTVFVYFKSPWSRSRCVWLPCLRFTSELKSSSSAQDGWPKLNEPNRTCGAEGDRVGMGERNETKRSSRTNRTSTSLEDTKQATFLLCFLRRNIFSYSPALKRKKLLEKKS